MCNCYFSFDILSGQPYAYFDTMFHLVAIDLNYQILYSLDTQTRTLWKDENTATGIKNGRWSLDTSVSVYIQANPPVDLVSVIFFHASKTDKLHANGSTVAGPTWQAIVACFLDKIQILNLLFFIDKGSMSFSIPSTKWFTFTLLHLHFCLLRSVFYWNLCLRCEKVISNLVAGIFFMFWFSNWI
jgi:hypothetical protein